MFRRKWNVLPEGALYIDEVIGCFISHYNYAGLSSCKIQYEIREALQQDFVRFDPGQVRFCLEINSELEIFALPTRTDVDGQIKLNRRLKVCNGNNEQVLTFFNERIFNGQYETLIDKRCYLDDDYRQGSAYCAWVEPVAVDGNPEPTRLEFDGYHTLRMPTIKTEDGDVRVQFDLNDRCMRPIEERLRDLDLTSVKFSVILCVKLAPDGTLDKVQFRLFVGKRPSFAIAKNWRQWFEHDGLVYRKRINKDILPEPSLLNPFTGLH